MRGPAWPNPRAIARAAGAVKRRAGRLAAAGWLVAVALAGTAVPASAWPPPGSYVVAGEVEQSVLVSTADMVQQLGSLPVPVHTVTVSFIGPSGPEQHTFTGVLLYDSLTFLGPLFDPTVKNDKLRFYIATTGSDGYQAIVAWGEIDPSFENKGVLLAFIQDGQSLAATGPRLVVPNDIHGGRYVSDIVSIRLERVPPDPVVQFLPFPP
ncbi:MAG TPA: hypothetical protein VEL75_01195 [Candidatus Methylomirabilis sp.]|nr:hypothetical protein [Candidatus Methylomirabilis sp.]